MCPEFSACYSIEWTTEGKEVVYQILLPKLNRAAYQDHDFHKHNALLYFLTIFILAYLSSNHARKNLDFQGKSILFWINIWFFNREPEAVFVPQMFVPENGQFNREAEAVFVPQMFLPENRQSWQSVGCLLFQAARALALTCTWFSLQYRKEMR